MPDSGSFPGTILQEFIAVGRPNRPGRAIHPTSITMHNTSNTSPGADAKAHSRFVRNTGHYVLRSGRKNWVSWHYTVDDNVAIQHLPNTEMGWHAGPANGSSIGIEVCMHQGINRDLADRRAAALVAKLLRDLGLTRNDIKTHKDWTRKDCPTLLLPQWQAFLALVDDVRSALPPPPMAVAPAASRRAVEKAPRLAKKDLGEIDHHLMAIPDELLSSAAASAEDGLVKASLATVFDQLTALTRKPESRTRAISERHRSYRSARQAADRVQTGAERAEERVRSPGGTCRRAGRRNSRIPEGHSGRRFRTGG